MTPQSPGDPKTGWTCFRVEVQDRVAHVVLDRPDKRNSMIPAFWRELPALIRQIDGEAHARAIVLSSEGPHFTAGMDLSVFASLAPQDDSRDARLQRPLAFLELVRSLQVALSSLETCRIPVIAAVQGGCIGGGVDLVTACDIRFASSDAFFTIEETNLGMTADVGTFPRLVKLIPEGVVRELAYTGRRLTVQEAQAVGLVNRILDDHARLVEHALSLARTIAQKAPIAVHGCKRAITFARDHATAEGLDFIGLWNASMLSVEQVMEAIAARTEGREGDFVDLPPLDPALDA